MSKFDLELEAIQHKYELLISLIGILQMFIAGCKDACGQSKQCIV